MSSEDISSLLSEKRRIADRLRQARESLKLTQAEVARKSGLGRSAITHYENAKAVPGGMELIKLAQALETTPNFILSGSKRFHPSSAPEHLLATTDETALIARISFCLLALDREVRESVSALLMALVKQRLASTEYELFKKALAAMTPFTAGMMPDVEKLLDRMKDEGKLDSLIASITENGEENSES